MSLLIQKLTVLWAHGENLASFFHCHGRKRASLSVLGTCRWPHMVKERS